MDTWRLYVRTLVRGGRWPEAVQLIVKSRDIWVNPSASLNDKGRVPAAVWAELLSSLNLSHARRTSHARLDGGLNSHARYNALMRLRETVVLHASSDGPSMETTRLIVEAFLRMGEHKIARAVTFAVLGAYNPSQIVRIANLHIALRAKNGTRSFYAAYKELEEFTRACPSLKPTAVTFFLLLGHLRRAKQCASVAEPIVRAFVSRWGHRVLSPKVRRRLLSLAVKEGHRRLIRQWATLGMAQKVAVRAWKTEDEVAGRTLDLSRVSPRAHEGRENVSWWRAVWMALGKRIGRG